MVLIFTEAGKQDGYGHLMRCLAIAQGFKKRQIKPIFYLRGNPGVDDILKGFSRRIVDWLKVCVDVKGRIVIIDSYHAGRNFCKQVYKVARKVIFIDDNKRIPYPGGYVLNSSILSEDISYPDNPRVGYLLGPKYHPLRREFWEVPVKVIRKRVEKVLVTFGGSDMTNATLRILKILKEQYPDFKKSIIVGRGFSNINRIKTEAGKNTALIYSPDAQSMKREMLKTDICISGGGQTTYELARLGVPTIGICFAHNQLLNLTGFARHGFIKFAGWYNEKTVCNKIKECLDTLTYKNRLKMSRAGRKLVDGSGAMRVAMAILSDEPVCKYV